MRLKSLRVGMVVKNYKELCQLLKLEMKTGGAKRNQLDWIGEYVTYTKKGHRFIIEEVASDVEVEPMDDGRSSGNNKIPYIIILEKLILDLMLKDANDNMIFLSKTQMIKQLSMVNENYSIGKVNIEGLSDLINIDEKITNDWYTSTDAMLQRNIKRALNSLRNQALVMWSLVTTVSVNEDIPGEETVTTETKHNKNGRRVTVQTVISRTREVHRESTNEEDREIIKAERIVLKELNCEGIQQVIGRGMYKKYDEKVKEILNKDTNINYYYNSYKVVFNKEFLTDRSNELDDFIMTNIERENDEEDLSLDIQERNMINAQKRHEDSNTCFGKSNSFRARDHYIQHNELLNKTLISKEHPNITKAIISSQKERDELICHLTRELTTIS